MPDRPPFPYQDSHHHGCSHCTASRPRKYLRGILLKLEEQDQSLALDILRVILFSERELDIAEVVEAVAVTPTTRNLQKLRNNALRRPNDVFQLCGSLIRKSQTTGKISLSHYSVKEFLSHPFLGKGRRNPFFLQEIPSQKSQFEKCILYLSLEDFTSETFRETLRLALDPLYTDSDIQVMASFPFLDYASNYWVLHLRHLSSEDFQAIWPLLKSFLDGKQGSFDSYILISQYSHGDYKFPHGATAIHVAALYGLEVMLACLLKADSASCTQQTLDGRTPLHIALENQQEKIIDLLLRSHLKMDLLIRKLLMTRDERGRTPLHTAIESGSEVAVVQLVTAGANVNVIQPDGRTPISVAVENQWDLLAEFLSQMADPTQSLSDGRSLLHIAAESGSLTWTTALLKFHEDKLIDAQDGNDWTPLHYAMDREHLHIARALVESHCLIEVYDKNDWTPLHAAIRRRNLECASLILGKDWSGSRPRRASPRPSVSSFRGGPFVSGHSTATTRRGADQRVSGQLTPSPSLSGKYADELRRNRPYESYSVESSVSDLPDVPNLPRRRKPSPLHLAVTDSYTEGVELLAQHQDKLSQLGSHGNEKLECLNMAIESANTQITLLLMKMLSKRELEGSLLKLMALCSDPIEEYLKTTFTSGNVYVTHIPKAILSNKESIIPSMIRIWLDADEVAIQAAIRQHPKLAKTFIKNGIALSKVLMEESQDPLLHLVIVERDLDFARYLIENGANFEVRNDNGETPLLALTGLQTTALSQKEQQECLDLAQALVRQGADIHALDQRFRGLCHKAASAGKDRFLEWALQTLNLDPSSRDSYSRTPLLLAVESGLIGTVHLLLRHLLMTKEGDDNTVCARVIDAMEYVNMRSAPLIRAMVTRSERNVAIVTALVEADEKAFRKLSPARQTNLISLRMGFYIEALTWAIDCNFSDGFTFLLPKIPKAALSSRSNLDGDTIYHVAAAAKSNEYLKTLLQTLASQEDFSGKALNSPNAKKTTPLDIVIECGSVEKISFLLLHGVKPTEAQLLKAKEKGIDLSEDLLPREIS